MKSGTERNQSGGATFKSQCTKDNSRVEFFEDEIFTESPPMLSRTVGGSFV